MEPSPSLASSRQIVIQIAFSAWVKRSKAYPSLSIIGFPASPEAMTAAVSLVEVSPSTETILKVCGTTLARDLRSISGVIAVSVVMKQRMVAMFG